MTPKMSLCLFTSKATWSRILPKIGRRHFKHQILSESNKNCKVIQNSQKRGTHEVSGHSDIIWPNFTSPTAEQQLPAATVSKTPNPRSKPTDGLKIPPKGSMSSFKSNQHRLTRHQLSSSKIKPLGSENYQSHHSSNRAHGRLLHTSKGLHIKFQVILTMFDPLSMLGNKIKPTGGGAPRDHGTQFGACGSSQNDSSRLPVEFQVNRT